MKFSLKNVFLGKSKPARRKAPRRGFGQTESFESRVMLTAMVGQVGDVLQVEGTNNDDTIEISYADEAQTQVQATVSDADGNVLASGQFNAANIDSIEVNALGGDDDVRNNTNIESKLNGNDGNDLLQGGTNDDDLNGGNGVDQKFDGDVASIEEEDGIVLVTGTNATDVIRVQYTDSSRDEILITIRNAAGNLLEEENYSADSVDRIIVNSLNGSDYVRNFTSIESELNGGNGNDALSGGSSDDLIKGGFGADRLSGYSGNDVLLGEADDDTIKGGYGNDIIEGGRDSDVISGGDGNDTIYGDRTYLTSFRAGDDVVNGGDGNDTIYGGYGNDTLNGNDGNDTIAGERGNDRITGGNGNDLLFGDSTNLNDTRGGDDVISGNDGIDQLFGGVGNDTLDGGAGLWDVLYGMDGNDTLRGGAGTDYMYGGDGDDNLYGGSGRDFLRGQAGDDTLDGGADGENDFLSGGTGADTFVDHYSLFFQNFRLRRVSEDTLDDYDSNEDTKIAKLKRFF